MEKSVHDKILYGYQIFSDDEVKSTYTITLHTTYQDVAPIEYTDIILEKVVAHHFTIELANSIIFDIEESDIITIYEENKLLFEKLKKYSWPIIYNTQEDLMKYLNENGIKAFVISSSYGLEGWIWAEKMTKYQRKARKLFTSNAVK